MTNLILRAAFLLFFLTIVSQGIFYLFALNKALASISIDAYAEIRNATDQVIEWRLKLVYPAALLIGVVTTLLQLKNSGIFVLVTTAIALLCVIVDLVLAVKFNVPINLQFHKYSATLQEVDWVAMRQTWLQTMEYRGLVQVLGFISLLLSWWKF